MFILKRALSFIPAMLLFYTIIFTLVHLIPGNPWERPPDRFGCAL